MQLCEVIRHMLVQGYRKNCVGDALQEPGPTGVTGATKLYGFPLPRHYYDLYVNVRLLVAMLFFEESKSPVTLWGRDFHFLGGGLLEAPTHYFRSRADKRLLPR